MHYKVQGIAAGLGEFRLHDLCHTFASLSTENGWGQAGVYHGI